MESGTDEDFVVNRIDGDSIHPIRRAHNLRARSLDDADRRFFSGSSAAEYQDRLRERTADHNFVVDRIVSDVVHRPAEPCELALQLPGRFRIFLCQPGEGRNLRMHHSVRHQDLLPLGIIRHGCSAAERQRHMIARRAADDAQRRNIAVCP